MSTLDTLRAKAAKLADQVAAAEGKAEAEAAAIRERNAERVRAYWSGPGAELHAAQSRLVADARRAFTAAVAGGDGAEVVTAYLAYARTHAEAQAFTRAAASATAHVDAANNSRSELPAAFSRHPAEFGDMLRDATRDLAERQGAAYKAMRLQKLRDSLEAEDSP